MYHPIYLRARERNRTAAYRRERRRRHTVVEGIFASLDRLGWEKSRLRGLRKVDCEGYMAALAYNVKKMVRRLGRGIGPPDPASPDAGIIAGYENIMINGAMDPTAPAPYSSLVSWLVIYLIGLVVAPIRMTRWLSSCHPVPVTPLPRTLLRDIALPAQAADQRQLEMLPVPG